MKNNLLHKALEPVFRRNFLFKNSFIDQTCYIFGNGASLKSIDFSHFTNYPTIGINHLVLHKDFYLLDTCCYTLPEPFSFYHYFKNPYKQKYEKNIMGNLFRSEIAKFPELNLFTSFTNMLGAPLKNTHYLHHFGKRDPHSNYLDICSEFSYLAGGLYAAIGLAISLGFKKAILVGCDYLMKPKSYGHFYAQPKLGKDDGLNPYEMLLKSCSSQINLEAISDFKVDCWIPCTDYETYTGASLKYRENTEIVTNDNLLILNNAYEMGQYHGRILPIEHSTEV